MFFERYSESSRSGYSWSKVQLSNCYHNFIFDEFLQLGYKIPVTLIILLSMPECKKFWWFFKSTSFLTKNVSKQTKLALVKMVNINYLCHNISVQWQFKRLFTCLAMILSLPIAKHRANLVVFNQLSKFSK